MPLSITERYIFRRMMVLFLAAMASTLAIAWTTQVLRRINLVTDTGQSAAAFLELATLIIPTVIPEILPFAVAIAVALTLTTMNTDSELVVINAAGSRRSVTARPVVILALIACALAFLVQNLVEPYTRQRVRDMVASARADLLSSVIQEGVFRKIDDGLYLQVGQRRADGKLGSVFVADSRQQDVDLHYYAQTAVVARIGGAGFLVMEDGQVHRKRPGEPVSIISYTTYAFDLSEFTASAAGEVFLLPKDRSLAYLLNPDPNDRVYNSTPQLFRAEIHRRLTTWLYPLAFALIALAVAGDARSHREARLNPLVSTIALALLVRWGGYFSFGKADTQAAYVPLMYAVPLAACAIALFFFVTGRHMELPTGAAERIAQWQASAQERLDRWRIRASGFRRGAKGAGT